MTRKRSKLLAGLILLTIGIVFLFREIFSWFNLNYVWPLLIIAIGIYLIARREK